MFELMQILFRVVLNYIVIFLTFRIMGKREIGELSIIDLIVFLMIAEITALSIEETEEPVFHSLLAIALLVVLQKLLSYISLKHTKIREKIEGGPSVIIANGKVNYLEMKKQRYTFDDLMNQLRDKDIRSLSEVDYAILESSGTLSVFKKGESNISPLPIILSGEFVKENFKYLDIDEEQVRGILKTKGYDDVKSILYANYENNELYIVKLEPDHP